MNKGTRKPPAEYKYRPREHKIADLSVNSVERIALLQGHVCTRFSSDYGYDLQMFTFSEEGTLENGFVLMQLKATDNIKTAKKGMVVAFNVTRADLKLWYEEIYPVILIVWDAELDKGYWLDVQEYLEKSTDYPLPLGKASLSVHLPITNIVDDNAIEQFRQIKEVEKVLERASQKKKRKK